MPLSIKGKEVERVSHFRFLGTEISEDLKWNTNIDKIFRKSQQRLYFLRRLKSFRLSTLVMVQFYRAVIESILTFSITAWYSGATQHDKNRLERVRKTASKIIGCNLPSIDELHEKRMKNKVKSITKDPSHPAFNLLKILPSGKRFQKLKSRTSRFSNSFYPTAATSTTP